MATGGGSRLSRSKIHASDELIEFPCSPCLMKKKETEAQKFCVECQEYLCIPCVENHNSFAALSGHNLLGKSQFGSQFRSLTGNVPGGNLPPVPTERCKTHPAKVVDMYCENHDSVGCTVCFTMDHGPCRYKHYIPDYVQKMSKRPDMPRIKKQLNESIKSMHSLKKQQQKLKDDLNSAKLAALQEIRDFRQEINQAIDRLEQASIDDIDKKYKTTEKDLHDKMTRLTDVITNLTQGINKMDSSGGNESQQFVSAKICQQSISEAVSIRNQPSNVTLYDTSIEFKRNSELLHSLQTLQSLGSTSTLVVQSAYAGRQDAQTHPQYQVISKDCYNVKQDGDRSYCDIWSACILDSKSILLADYRREKVKLLDGTKYKIVDSLVVSDCPLSVCRVSNKEAIVCLNNNTLQFVSTKPRLKPLKTLKMSHSCIGIAVSRNGQMFVSDAGKHVYIYTLAGELQTTIGDYGDGTLSFSREIVISDDGKKIHVADMDKGLITLDKDGNMIWKYSGMELKDAWGVCTDGQGNVFVGGYGSKNVIQIGPDGQYVREVVSSSQVGKQNVQAICFDRSSSKLIVCCADYNDIYVFTLQSFRCT